MGRNFDVICVGAALVDVPLKPVDKSIFDHESYPLDNIAMTIGGDAINEATVLSRLGAKVVLNALVGDDPAGWYIRSFCEKNGVDTEGLTVDSAVNTSINIGLVAADGERTFVTNRNGSLWKMELQHVNMELIAQARVLSLASFFNNPRLDGKALVEVFRRAKDAGLIICADMIFPRLGETLEDVREALSYVDYFFANRDEAALLAQRESLQEIADVFLAAGVRNIIIKVGKDGCYIQNAEQAYSIPAFKGAKMADTIGAGDNFAAGFIRAVLDGRSVKECGEYANAVASLSVEGVGATSGVRSREQVKERYDAYRMQGGDR